MSAADGTYSYTMTAKDAILTDAAYIEGLTYNVDGDYFEIASVANLNALATYVNNGNDCTGITFKQTQDITFGSEDAHTAIGKNSATQFKGTFDGQGKTISNLKAIGAGEDQGLFGYVGANGTVKNVNLANAEITGYENVGGIVGFNYGSVSDCSVVNSALEATRTSASDEYVGGIVGRNRGTVNKCIVDTLSLTTASECTKARVGGIIGYTYDGTLDSDCLALNVSMNVDAENAGALIGRLRNDSKTTVLGNYYNCVNGDGTTALKGVGYNYQGTDSTRQVYKFDLGDNTVEVSGGITYGGAIYAPSGTTLTFTGTSETGNWYVDNVKLTASGNTYSYTVGTADATLTDTVSIDGFSYNEAGNYFEIETAADLEHLSSYVLNGNSTSDLTFKQIADIDMSAVESFTPIGNGATQFKGTFDGNGKTIDNLTVNAATDYKGLFGYVGTDGTVANVTLIDANITGGNYVGGVVGYNCGKLDKCIISGDSAIKSNKTASGSDYSHTGGVVGYNNSNTVSGCIADGVKLQASGKNAILGGVVGYSTNGTVDSDCLAVNTSVTADSDNGNVGAAIGRTWSTEAESHYYKGTKNVSEALPGLGYKNNSEDNTKNAYKIALAEGVTAAGGVVYDGALYAPSGTAVTVTPAPGTDNLFLNNALLTAVGGVYSFNVPDKDSTLSDHPEITGLAYNSDTMCFEIGTVAELQALATYANAGNDCAGITFKQVADIDLSSVANFTAIGDESNQFKGTFDGGNFKISNLKISSTDDYEGLFAVIGAGGTVKNVRLENAVVSGTYCVGGITGRNNGTIDNCVIFGESSMTSAEKATANYLHTGGIVGWNYGAINGCISDSVRLTSTATDSKQPRVGGIAGYSNSRTLDSNCLVVNADITAGGTNTGAMIGRTYGGTTNGYYYKGTKNASTSLNSIGYKGGGTNNAEVAYKLTLPDVDDFNITGKGVVYDSAFYTASGTTVTFSGTSGSGSWYVDNAAVTGNTLQAYVNAAVVVACIIIYRQVFVKINCFFFAKLLDRLIAMLYDPQSKGGETQMRKLNLLRQLLLTANIGDLLDWKPSTRHIAMTLQIINSQYGWRDSLTISDSELLRRAGYKRSRYSSALINTFKQEASAANVIQFQQQPRATIYQLTELTNEMLTTLTTSLPISFTPCPQNSPAAADQLNTFEGVNNNGNRYGNDSKSQDGDDDEGVAALRDYLQSADL